jgi:hypothetical protein
VDAHHSWIAGEIPRWLALPGGVGRQRFVRITPELVRHLIERRPSDAAFCLANMALVLRDPGWVGHRASDDVGRIELAGPVAEHGRLLLVAVKFLDDVEEAWVSTTYPWNVAILTRRLRNGTMREVRRGREDGKVAVTTRKGRR